jgi:hypothetical protein
MSECSSKASVRERQGSRSLSQLVILYTVKFRNKARKELEGFRDEPFHVAIERAALAVKKDGGGRWKRFSHQRRLKQKVLEEARAALLGASAKLRRAKDFDDLHESIKDALAGITGLGSLYYYDTALRIGANLHKMPERVYLHRGTRRGARAMGLDWRESSLDPECLPKELASLEPHETEDFLCIFKDRLGNA